MSRWQYKLLSLCCLEQKQPVPPDYSIYTLLTFEETIIAGLLLFIIHFVFIMALKILTSSELRKKRHFVFKIIHGMENHNYATPYSDWDEGVFSIKEFRARFRASRREMAATFCLNIIFTAAMIMPLSYTGIWLYLYSQLILFKSLNIEERIDARSATFSE